MNGSTLYKLSVPVAASLAIFGLAAWSAGLLAVGGDWYDSLPLLVAGVALFAAGVAVWVWRNARSKAGVVRYFNLLCQFEPDELRDPSALARLPDISAQGF